MSVMDPVLTHHARKVMANRAVTFREVNETIRNYENRYASPYHKGRVIKDTFVYQRGSLSVVVNESVTPPRVVTVLLNSRTRWTDEEVAHRHD